MTEKEEIARKALMLIWQTCMPNRKGYYPRDAAKKSAEIACNAVGEMDNLGMVVWPSGGKDKPV